jgi:predicted enzyme related to lactoylglutathione lyase
LPNGRISYIEMPSEDVAGSESFYRKVFGWNIRRRGDGNVAFDDAADEVGGSWVLGRPPMREVGLLVDSVAATLEEVAANGEQPIGADAPETTARFRDPSGNVMGLYQEPVRSRPVEGRPQKQRKNRRDPGMTDPVEV